MDGWIKLYRQFTAWEWYNDIPTKVLFIHLLIKANSLENKWRGLTINRGQFFTSLTHLSEETGLTIKQIRGAIGKLKTTGEIAIEGASNGTMITICKYDSYQALQNTKGTPKGKRRASEGQAKGNNKEEEEYKKEKDLFVNENFKEFTDWLNTKGHNVKKLSEQVTPDQYDTLVKNFGLSNVIDIFLKMNNYKPLAQKNISAYLTANNWLKRDLKKI